MNNNQKLILNLEGVPCPQNTARAMLKLSSMDKNEILEVIIDKGEPVINMISSLEDSGYQLISKDKLSENNWKLKIKVE